MFFERPDSGAYAVLVHIDFPEGKDREDAAEFKELVSSAGLEPITMVAVNRKEPHPKYFLGTGKLDDVKEIIRAHDASLVIFNHALSPSQERNIEKHLECRVLDRTGLILEIFAQRARTHEGKLQVELAQLQHQSTRLIRGWTHLERQAGGVGMRGGPGETQLEIDRRLIRDRIGQINSKLEKVRKQRTIGRQARKRSSTPTVSIVGYTNAGKSTLFNALTEAKVYVADQLFATLDPTIRRLILPNVGEVVLADTVGFIRHLPHGLVEAFKATLEETAQADLLLHVIDAANPERSDNIEQVNKVLAEVGADKVPTLHVYNKIDLLDASVRIDRNETDQPWRVWVSAIEALGFDELRLCIGELTDKDIIETTITLAPAMSRFRAALYDIYAIVDESIDDKGQFLLNIRIQQKDFLHICRKLGIEPKEFIELRKFETKDVV